MEQPTFAMGMSHSIAINDAERSLVIFTWAVGFLSWILGRYQLLRNFCKINVGWTPTSWQLAVLLVWKKSKAIRDGRMLWGRQRGLYFSFHLRFDLRTRQQLLTIVPHIGVRDNSLTHPPPPPPSFSFRSALAISNHVLYIHFRSCC